MKRVILLVLAIAGVFVAATSQFRSYDRMAERRVAALSRPSTQLTVGVCWPFSTNQDGMADGLTLALDEIQRGKLAGPFDIRLVMKDDAFDWNKARNIAVGFADTPEMSAVLGYYDDGPAVKASAIYESAGLLDLITGANNASITRHGFRFIVRTVVSSPQIAYSLARKMAARGYRKYAVLWEEDAFGEDLAYQFRVELDELNLPVVHQWSYVRERADFRQEVNELKGVDADVIFFSGLEPWAGDFLRAAHAVGLKTPIVGAFSDTPEMRARSGPGLEGAMFFDLYNPGPLDALSDFARKFRTRFGRLPDAWAAQGYDALMILAKAAKFTRSRNPLDLSYAIRYMDAWEGANGRYKFTPAGDVEDKPVFLRMFRSGVPEILE